MTGEQESKRPGMQSGRLTVSAVHCLVLLRPSEQWNKHQRTASMCIAAQTFNNNLPSLVPRATFVDLRYRHPLVRKSAREHFYRIHLASCLLPLSFVLGKCRNNEQLLPDASCLVAMDAPVERVSIIPKKRNFQEHIHQLSMTSALQDWTKEALMVTLMTSWLLAQVVTMYAWALYP